jgi:hypothetical protein
MRNLNECDLRRFNNEANLVPADPGLVPESANMSDQRVYESQSDR